MKIFLLKLLLFLTIMFGIDTFFGLSMTYIQGKAKGGYIGHHNYILNRSNEDVLVFGSSRAIHHYNPDIIRDSLGLSCYNCGQDGNGIVLFYGWWQLIKNHYTPQIIIYDISPDFDLLKGTDNAKYLGWLRSEYDNKSIQLIFDRIDSTEKIKMMSKMYRYNSKFIQNLTDCFHPIFHIQKNGYLPLNGNMDKLKIRAKNQSNKTLSYDTLKIQYLIEFIKDCKNNNVKLYFVASPLWYGTEDSIFNILNQICNKYKIPFYNYTNDHDFFKNDQMFIDGTHLNAYGADVFTSKLVSNIQKELRK